MPVPTSELLFAETTDVGIAFSLEPAYNVQHSLLLLSKAEDVSGLNDWVYRTAAAMSPEEHDTNRLVMIGFYYATRPRTGYPSFPVYLEHLATVPPLTLRDKVLDAYTDLARDRLGLAPGERPDYDAVLADVNSFLAFLRQGFDDDHIIVDLERRAYTYLIDPPALQQAIVGHMRSMWYKYLAVEWERVRPMLQKAVRAFEQLDYSGQSREAIVEQVIGRSLKEDCWEDGLATASRIVFVPSAHVGPYLARLSVGNQVWLLFGARQPEGLEELVPELSRAELLVRLSALSDDTRLSILRLVAEAGELRSQDIMQQLDLSQSAASRHLQQLTAAGFLVERRCNGAKCYRLSGERIDKTLSALGSYLAPRAEPVEPAVPSRWAHWGLGRNEHLRR